jgi:hypothetical protein
MFNKILVSAGLLAALVAPLAANAGEVQNRVYNEQHRINQGVRNGALTHREYNHVQNRLSTIEAQRNRDLRRNDGRLTYAEKRNLNRKENNLSRQIYFDKHNRAHQQ